MRIPRLTHLSTLLVAAVIGCYPQIDTGPDEQSARPVDVIELRRGLVIERLSLIGTTQPWQEATLYFEVSGIVAEVYVEEGNVVETGDPIAQLVLTDYELALSKAGADRKVAQAKLDRLNEGTRKEDLDAARANHARSKANAAYWITELPRNRDLFRKKAITDTELAQVQREHDAAVQDEASANAQLEKAVNGPRKEDIEAAAAEVESFTQAVALAQRQLDKATVRAPFGGRIEKRLLDVGAYVNVFPTGGVPVAHLVDLSKIDAVIAVPEGERSRVQDLQQVELASAVDPRSRGSGKVIALGQVADQATGTYELRARIANEQGEFTGGMVVAAEIADNTSRQAIRIPLSALLRAYGRSPYVLLVDPGDDQALAREVKLGAITGDQVEIVDGLAEGDLLIVRGHDRVIPGDRVKHRLTSE